MKETYWKNVWLQFRAHYLGVISLFVVILFVLAGIYAPFLASSKPLVVRYDGEWYFPLFRYLFYPGFYTKRIDLFFNGLTLTFPLMVLALYLKQRVVFLLVVACQLVGFLYFIFFPVRDPSVDLSLVAQRQTMLADLVKKGENPTWKMDVDTMNGYAQLNLLLRYQERFQQHERVMAYAPKEKKAPTLWQIETSQGMSQIEKLKKQLETFLPESLEFNQTEARIRYLEERRRWLQEESKKITVKWMPLLRPFHWEDDVGGEQSMNQYLPWWELTRINRKDLVAGLIFGVRISLVVGVMAVALAMAIGIPIGAFAGYYAGRVDILVSRLLEIWEAMPTFFMLLLVVAVTQSKSIFIVIAVVGIFGWTGFSRYIRGEFFKQRSLPYVEACQALGFRDRYIIFSHILPNAIPPVLTMLPFAIMGAMTSEAGLSFLGLGEEGSCSWGVLMDEGRSAFPGESYLLWPPAFLLTVLLIAIALVGDALRDVLDPKMH